MILSKISPLPFELEHEHTGTGAEDIGEVILPAGFTNCILQAGPIDTGSGYGLSLLEVLVKAHPNGSYVKLLDSSGPVTNITEYLVLGNDGITPLTLLGFDMIGSPYAVKFRGTALAGSGDLITDGDMSNAASWTDNQSNIGGGVYTTDRLGNNVLIQDITFPAAGDYEFSVDCLAVADASTNLVIGATGIMFVYMNPLTVATKTATITIPAPGVYSVSFIVVEFNPAGGTVIDNLSISLPGTTFPTSRVRGQLFR